MPVRGPKISAGDRVMHDGYACLVLMTTPRKLTIRNKYGFAIEIPRKGVKLAPKD